MKSRLEMREPRYTQGAAARAVSRLAALALLLAFLGPAALPASPASSAGSAALKSAWQVKSKAHPAELRAAAAVPAISGAVRAVVFEEPVLPEVAQTWRWNPPGEVIAPILLYHHVGASDRPSRYYVSPQEFEAQMRSLKEWGYTVIPLSLLVRALTEGAILPPRPVVISFDDGNLDVFENAFPVMQALGYPGIAFIITGQLEIGGFMHAEQLLSLQAAGWEIGSHTQTHTSLRASYRLEDEIARSRQVLETILGTPVSSFSFPYGLTSPAATRLVRESGYTSAVGLGGLSRHTPKTQYYLSRIEIRVGISLQEFASLLPWGAEAPAAAADDPDNPRQDVK